VGTSKTFAAADVQAAITRLTAAIAGRHQSAARKLIFLGVANGGIELAKRCADAFGARAGTLDISFHRDDIGRHPIPKEFVPTRIPADVQGATVVLVDDVLFSGRTVKAALEELFDHGRPTKVELAVLVDRGERRLPVAADYVGMNITASPEEKIVVALDSENPKHDAIHVERRPADSRRSPL
jgi:pyrimidine operon attenuation protein / uracil phosphoribosyltransferase